MKAAEVLPLSQSHETSVSKVHLILRSPGIGRDQLADLKRILLENQGETTAVLHLIVPSQGETVIRLPIRVDPSSALLESFEAAFGYPIAQFEQEPPK